MQSWVMRLRSLLLGLTAIAFLATTSFGLHSHEADEEDEDAVSLELPGHEHHHHSIYLASELSAAHLAEHLLHGDVDVDSPVMPLARSSAPLVFLFLTFFYLVAILVRSRRISFVLPVERPLRPPRRAHLLPPSQAPPCSA